MGLSDDNGARLGNKALNFGVYNLSVLRPLVRTCPIPLSGGAAFSLRRTKDVLFLGWFGPIGAAALYYATHALRETGVEQVWTVSSFVIVASVVAHGVTDTPLTKLYGRFPRGEPDED